MRIKTIKVIGEDDAPLIINESDFDKKVHKLWPEDKPAPEAEPEVTEQPDAVAVHKGAGRWVVEAEGKAIHEGTLTKAAAAALANEK